MGETAQPKLVTKQDHLALDPNEPGVRKKYPRSSLKGFVQGWYRLPRSPRDPYACGMSLWFLPLNFYLNFPLYSFWNFLLKHQSLPFCRLKLESQWNSTRILEGLNHSSSSSQFTFYTVDIFADIVQFNVSGGPVSPHRKGHEHFLPGDSIHVEGKRKNGERKSPTPRESVRTCPTAVASFTIYGLDLTRPKILSLLFYTLTPKH